LKLDPRIADMPYELGAVLTRLRKYAEAEAYYDRSLQLTPDQVYAYGLKQWNSIFWKGDLKTGRKILEQMPEMEPGFFHSNWIRQEILERNYQKALDRLEKIPVDVFQEESLYMPKTLMMAMLFDYSNQKEKAREQYEVSRRFLEKKIQEGRNIPAVHEALGTAYAGLGRKEDAIREGKLAVEMIPVSKDAFQGPGSVITLAQIYTMTGEFDQALDQLDYLLSIPSWFSIRALQLEPVWDPLRSHPRYPQLIKKFSNQ
jgi:tetratricopeptide (TPR) repeat protein